MTSHKETQTIGQLEPRKGGYFFLTIHADVVNQFEHKRKTRFICRLEDSLEFQCGLSHLGDGNFFIILSKKNLEKIGKKLDDSITFELREDPNPLGVDMPEALEVLLEQDGVLKETFQSLTAGKQRGIIHQMNRIKSIDKKISKAIELINTANLPRKRK
ncbi:MAG: YdeI/OmpD-associated family protein [Bacteroidota bacterium]